MPFIYQLPRQQGMLPRLLSAIILLFIVATSFFLGIVLFMVILGAVVVLALVLYLRFWWLRRKLADRPKPSPQGGVTLEGEYSVSRPSKHADGEKR